MNYLRAVLTLLMVTAVVATAAGLAAWAAGQVLVAMMG